MPVQTMFKVSCLLSTPFVLCALWLPRGVLRSACCRGSWNKVPSTRAPAGGWPTRRTSRRCKRSPGWPSSIARLASEACSRWK